MTIMNECVVVGCHKPVKVAKRRMCDSHFQVFARANKPRVGHFDCKINGCEAVVYARGMCERHWNRWKYTGSPYPKVKEIKLCSVDECDRQVKALGLCATHYIRNYHGMPMGGAIEKKQPSYNKARKNLYKVRGQATEHTCIDCGLDGRWWALKPDARIETDDWSNDTGREFSLYPEDYDPVCTECNRARRKAS